MVSKRRLLVLEDDPDQASGMVDMLEEAGYEVEQCVTSEEVERKLKASSLFDAFVFDFAVGTINSLQLIEKVGTNAIPPSRVIMVTAYENEITNAAELKRLPDIRRIVKPSWVEELLPALDRLFREIGS